MAVAETNKIITHGDGQSIATSIQNIANAINDQEKNVHLSDAQTITGAKTFTSPIKTSEIDNTAGNAMLRNKDTEGAIVLGSVSKKAVIMGSGDRPTYSKDGSDFAGSELALKSDVQSLNNVYIPLQMSDVSSLLYKQDLRGMNVTISNAKGVATNFDTICGYMKCKSLTLDFGKTATSVQSPFMLASITDNKVKINLDASSLKNAHSLFKNLNYSIDESSTFTNFSNVTSMYEAFRYYLGTNIPALDLSNVTVYSLCFDGAFAITSFLAYGMKESFGFYGDRMTAEALRVVIDNLADVTAGGVDKTLTIGSSALAKLNADDITTANNKGWNLA